MKKNYFSVFGRSLLWLACLGMVMQSCKKGGGFLSATSTTDLTETTVFTDSARTVGFLANIYSGTLFSANPNRFGNGGMDAATDEAEPSRNGATAASAFAIGTINAGIVGDQPYNTCYTNIRAVNQFLKNLPRTPMKAPNKAKMVSEARFLRAWYYAMLVKHYGGVPLVGDTLYSYETEIAVKRATYDQCVKYIVSELDAAALGLPNRQTGQDFGRASAGACLALKARVLLYAASPLFNGTTLPADAGGSTPADLVGYPTFDANRWKLAMDAAAAVIGSNVYSLNTTPVKDSASNVPGAGFQGLFTIRDNVEYIFQYLNVGASQLENLFLPPSRAGANGAFPYQGFVDAFPMANGKLITDATSGYNPNDPYKGRDPRLNYSIIHDQTSLLVRLGNGTTAGRAPVDIFIGNYNGRTTGVDAVKQGTLTGYYNNKMLDPNAVAATISFGSQRVFPLIRYAEILLNYAEAANEFQGPTGQVYSAINAIRQRAGLIPYEVPAGLDKAAMRTYIQNERRLELAYEEHRFWDVRRWKIAAQTENVQTEGMQVNRNGNTVSYNRFNITKHNFRPAMYLWPFPLSETGKSPTLIQNPGY